MFIIEWWNSLSEAGQRVFIALTLGGAFWCFFWWYVYRCRISNYKSQKAYAPRYSHDNCTPYKDAEQIKKLLRYQLKFISEGEGALDSPNYEIIRSKKKRILGFINNCSLYAFVSLLYDLGLGIRIFRLSHTLHVEGYGKVMEIIDGDEDIFKDATDFYSKPTYLDGKVLSFLTFLLSGGALLSIIAFFILRVQDN